MRRITATEARKMGINKINKYDILSASADGINSFVIIYRKGESIAVHARGNKKPFMFTLDYKKQDCRKEFTDILKVARIWPEQFYINGKINNIKPLDGSKG